MSPAPSLTPCRSLDNTSNVVRWSLDLRWQHPHLPDGAFGLKRPILMASSGGGPEQLDWAGWADVDKKSGSSEGLAAVDQVAGAWVY
jgi:hypothetical protein